MHALLIARTCGAEGKASSLAQLSPFFFLFSHLRFLLPLVKAVQLHDDLRSLNHELSEANAAQKEARKAKDEAKVKEIRSTVAQLKER